MATTRKAKSTVKRYAKSSQGSTEWDALVAKHLTKKEVAEAKAWAQREFLEMNLRALREMAGETQVTLAKKSKTTQGELSRIENRENHRISTLRKYIESLGGELEIFARFGKKTVRLVGI